MSSVLSKPLLLTGIRVLVGGLFVYAGLVKIIAPHQFRSAIASFQILPEPLLSPLALTLPPLELLTGGAWILNRWSRSAAVILLGLCFIFLGALTAALVKGIPADCGCFAGLGVAGSTSLWSAIARDLLLIGAIGWWLYTIRPTPHRAGALFPGDAANPTDISA